MPRIPTPAYAETIVPLTALRTQTASLLDLLRWRGVTQRSCREKLDIGWYRLTEAAADPKLFTLREVGRIAEMLEVEEMELVEIFLQEQPQKKTP